MDRNREILVSLLSLAIRGQKPDNFNFVNIDWKLIYEEANAHQILEILFPVVQQLNVDLMPCKEVFDTWTRQTIISGIKQANHIENMAEVLNTFKESGIDVITLKGLVLRDLYPQPLLRSMSDADILIHKQDLLKAKSILLSLGYFIKEESNPKEMRFFHNKKLIIELHWSLIDPGLIQNSEQFETHVWDNFHNSMLNSVPIYILSPEDQVLYLCLHMIAHIQYRGFGLRQLCDLVLLIEAKSADINWNSFNNRIKEFDITKFVYCIFQACELLFNLVLPIEISGKANDETIKLLINDIFEAGVFGNKSQARSYISSVYGFHKEATEKLPSLGRLYLNNLFPSIKSLPDKYQYAKKYPILILFAWIHRFIVLLFRDRAFEKTILHLKKPKGTETVFADRIKLLKKLDLR